MSTELIAIKKLSRTYVSEVETVHAVDKVDMAASQGEFIGLFGHSGSGKTTLLNLIAGIDLPTAGDLKVDGLDLTRASESRRIQLRRETVGMVHQSDHLIEEFTAAENVALPLEARGEPSSDALAAATELLERVGLDSHADRRPRQLSGGQRQRVGIARALYRQPSLLVLDEATSALDADAERLLVDVLAELRGKCTIVLIAHRISSLRRCDHVFELDRGAVVEGPRRGRAAV